MSRLATPYVPRQPQETVLYALVKEHLDAFSQHARESYAGPLPKYVVDEFRSYWPTLEELQETLKYIYARVMKWLARRGHLRDADASNEAPSYSASEALTLAGMQRGTLETAKDSGEPAEPDLSGAPPRVRDAAVHERFNLHASVHLAAHDDLGRERLVPLPGASGVLARALGRASRRPRCLSGEESRSRSRQAAGDDPA